MLLSVENRNDTACRHGLRRVALDNDDREGIRFVQSLVSATDPGGRYWLRNLLGERPEPQSLPQA